MRPVFIVIVLTLAVAGCGPSIKNSSPNHVTVESYQMNDAKALQAAEVECAKYHRRAAMTLKPTAREDQRDYIFACID
jgi:hypothetical protein